MKKVEIEIPDGKRIEWVNNVLTLVDDKPVNIMEKVRGYNDACKVLGIENFLDEPNPIMNMMGIDYEIPKNVIAMMKLETIIEALNEGWIAIEHINDERWSPVFDVFNKYNENDYKGHVVAYVDNNPDTHKGIEFTNVYSDDTNTDLGYGPRFVLKSRELANYCGEQFIQLWADFLLG